MAANLAPDQIKRKSDFSLEYVLDVCERAGIVTLEGRKEILVKEAVFRSRVLKDKGLMKEGAGFIRYEVSPPEIIAQSKSLVPGKDRPITEDEVMEAVGAVLGLQYRKLDPLKLNAEIVTSTLSRPFARRNVVLPVEVQQNRLKVAVANPFDSELFENIKRITGYEIEPVLAAKTDILRIITEFFGFKRSVKAAEKVIQVGVDISNLEQFVKLKSINDIEATDKHVVNAVDYLLHYAFSQHASDIHIEPKREHSNVRFRIDGVLHDIHQLPKNVHPAVVSRIKMLARCDIAEKRRPQDGRIKTTHGDKEVELRVSTLPVAFGEKVVIRIFDPEIMSHDLGELGFFPEELAMYEGFISMPHGMVLVTGPTGSGKTTTLYTTLREIASPEVNITTIEDPIEMVYEGLNQTAVQAKIDVTFASALRNILRQDPDIIMVGEIRDQETAEMSIQSALTGHLVFATLHTNDTAGTIGRFLELGAKPYLLSSVLIGVVAQRLVRSICPYCKRDAFLTPDQIASLGINIPEDSKRRLPVKYGEGCVTCRYTGYSGRTGIFEVLKISDKIRKLIKEKADSREVLKAARADGMMTLRESGIRKMAQGTTTFEEVMAATE
ncbi:MAG: type II/IV secretion system protein [Deltaproteobacteria bacterium]|nr:type II/IV secretion system protein [Deltaproteobacteria bacterium]